MPKERSPQFTLYTTLKGLSDESDAKTAEDFSLYDFSVLDGWVAAAKESIDRIMNCESISEIEQVCAPKVLDYLGQLGKNNKKTEDAVPVPQREHVHVASEIINKAAKNVEDSKKSSPKTSIGKAEICNFENKPNEKISPAVKPGAISSSTVQLCETQLPQINVVRIEDTDSDTVTLKNNKELNPVVLLLDISPQLQGTNSTFILSDHNCKNLESLTPTLNLTFNKASKVPTPDSAGSTSNCPKSEFQNNELETKTPVSKKLAKNQSKSSKKIAVKSGSKRKSSIKYQTKSSKKPKVQASEPLSEAFTSKAHPVRQPLVNKNIVKAVQSMSSANKHKSSSVIVPQPQKKTVVNKEQLILDEIKKKEVKVNENIKRVLAERQMKVEQNKKNREEKMSKTLQKRMLLEKEKEERIKKAEYEAKMSQAKSMKENIKNGTLKTKAQVLTEAQQLIQGSTAGVLTSSKQNERNGEVLSKTPVSSKKSNESDNYELTPHPNSSTYDFSDEEEDPKPCQKRIPNWAQGAYLKSVLIQQFYNPPNVDEIFGKVVESPDLAEIFAVKKNYYFKRTSSAVWNHRPEIV